MTPISAKTVLPSHSAPSKALVEWLTSSGSLTAMLEKKAGQALRVERVFEGWRPLTLTQKRQLGMARQCLNRPMVAWVREVWLYGDDNEPWLSAVSVFPLTSLKADAMRLKHLKGTPIGYVLFKRAQSLPHKRSISHTGKGWQRQTRYDWNGRNILISEVFLPNFVNQL